MPPLDVLGADPAWNLSDLSGQPREALAAALADADALIVRSATRADAELIAAAPRLRVIARAGTGVDNVDVEAATVRGILVLNTPGANSVSVAEHALALMLALARSITRADAAMKAGRWEKKGLGGEELRGKTLALIGLGRIGQEVAARAVAFDMMVVAHDPFISAQLAASLGIELLDLDEVCRRADYISLHIPATAATRRMVDRAFLAKCRPGVRVINTARGDLIDEAALADAIESGHVAGAGLDVFEQEPPADWRLAQLAKVVGTPHIAASTVQAQELVGLETAANVRDFLKDGIIRNPVNFPAIAAEDASRLQPFLVLADRLGSFVSQIVAGRLTRIEVAYFGELASGSTDLLTSAALVGLFRLMLSEGVTLVNARAVAVQRGIEVEEIRSSRARDFTSVMRVTVQTDTGAHRVEGTVFEPNRPRLVLVHDVDVEAPLEGDMIVIENDDQPGVIGGVGTILGSHGINIGSFALGRSGNGAVGVVTIDGRMPDAGSTVTNTVIEEIAAIPAVRHAALIRL